ncbi:hypothetical protein LTS18_005205 [Coniosporium uncinatum]|uniref:Uncharacterized protein n=1 Tax=Coniosporium uncinatum TaxID=93489 RepID=A0ACC3DBH7_9PEZI|nr:hypothetical protein LTS18_005205 [Coniosporium uncinatum]
MMADSTPPSPRPCISAELRYSAFNSHKIASSWIDNVIPLYAHVLTPKTLKPGKHPVLIRFHGGGLVEGVALGDWFRSYILAFAERESAIIISPEYRMLPEANGWEMLDDLRAFLDCLTADGGLKALGKHLDLDNVHLDIDRTAITAENAGAYLAIHALFQQPTQKLNIRALMLQSPMLDLIDAHFSGQRTSFPTTIGDTPTYPRDTFEQHLATLPQGRS